MINCKALKQLNYFSRQNSKRKRLKIIFRVILALLGGIIFTLQIFRFQDIPFFRLFSSDRKIEHRIYWIKNYQKCPEIRDFNYKITLSNCDQFQVGKIVRLAGRVDSNSAKSFFEKKELIIQEITVYDPNLFSVDDLKAVISGKFLEIQTLLKTNFYNYLIKIIDANSAELLAGMLWGQGLWDSNLEFKDIMRESGLSHVLSVSGFHLGLIFDIFSLTITKNWQWGRGNFSRGARIGTLICFLGLYTLVVGRTSSVLRAFFMSLFNVMNRDIFHHFTNKIFILISVVILMLLFNPFYLGDVGWLLSVFATLAIIIKPNIHLKKRPKSLESLLNALLLTVFVQILTLPILWSVFGEIQIIALLSNLVVLPIIPFLLEAGVIFWLISFLEEIHWFISIFLNTYGVLFAFLTRFLMQTIAFFANLDLPHSLPKIDWSLKLFLIYYLPLFIAIFCLKYVKKSQN